MPNNFDSEVDILVIPGGPDLIYTEQIYSTPVSPLHKASPQEWSIFMNGPLQAYIENGTKIFGICLGFQMLTAYFGGRLFSHIPGHSVGNHLVILEEKFSQKLGVDDVLQSVNSRHHQAISELPPELLPVAWSALGRKDDWKKTPDASDYGLLEAWIHATKPIVGVQWHPEGLDHKPESYYARKYGYMFGDIIANAMMNYLISVL